MKGPFSVDLLHNDSEYPFEIQRQEESAFPRPVEPVARHSFPLEARHLEHLAVQLNTVPDIVGRRDPSHPGLEVRDVRLG